MSESQLYLYSGKNLTVKDWAKVYAQKKILINDTSFELNIIGYSHQIIINKGEDSNTEILASIVPQNIEKQSLKISLQTQYELVKPNFEIKVINFEHEIIDLFLKHSNQVSYKFDKDSWTVIIWSIQDSQIEFETLHSYPDLNLIVLSKSKYKL
jgi:hypothetical protein